MSVISPFSRIFDARIGYSDTIERDFKDLEGVLDKENRVDSQNPEFNLISSYTGGNTVSMVEATVEDLREIVAGIIEPTIDLHRGSRAQIEGPSYSQPSGPPTDDEIDEFLFHNPLIEESDRMQLVDPGLLGYSARGARIDEEWLSEFEGNIRSWAGNNSWLGADAPWREHIVHRQPERSEIWTPDDAVRPLWLDATPSCVLIARELLSSSRLLSEIGWRQFEELIGHLLESDGWSVEVTRGSRDGGIDVIATIEDPTLGPLRSLWQAKKYAPTNKVKLHEVRELAGVLTRDNATKGLMVTTSRLTRGAIEWIKQDHYRMGYMEGDKIADWVRNAEFGG